MKEGFGERETTLLAVTGMSPAVLTETIWALCLDKNPIVPDRVVVVTTLAGRRRLIDCLFDPLERFGGVCPWEMMRRSLEVMGVPLLGKLRFGKTADDIRVLTAVDASSGVSHELEDIRSAEDNRAVADFVLEQVRAFAENPDVRLVASLAGGRKSMGALLYACMSLVGREDDLLTHVLVNDPFDSVVEFYFPLQPGGMLTSRSGDLLDPRDARVDLADVPFVALRNLFLRELGRGAGSFSRLVDTCRQNVRKRVGETLRLIVEANRTEIVVNDQRLRLSVREHLVMSFMAARAKGREPEFSFYGACVEPLNEFREELVAHAVDGKHYTWCSDERLRHALDERDISRLVSDLRRKLQGLQGDAVLLAGCLPEKGRFSLDVEPSLIEIRY